MEGSVFAYWLSAKVSNVCCFSKNQPFDCLLKADLIGIACSCCVDSTSPAVRNKPVVNHQFSLHNWVDLNEITNVEGFTKNWKLFNCLQMYIWIVKPSNWQILDEASHSMSQYLSFSLLSFSHTTWKVAHWTFFSGALDVFCCGTMFLLLDYFWPLLNVNKLLALWTFFSGTLDIFYLNEVKKYFFVNKTNTFLMKYIIFIVFYTSVCKTIGI